MSGQKFYASPTNTFTWANGAVGHRPGGPMDCLGPYAKVKNCPIDGTFLRRTCYATGYADTAFSIPAVTTVGGKRIKGFFYTVDGIVVFVPIDVERTMEPLYSYCQAWRAAQAVERGVDG